MFIEWPKFRTNIYWDLSWFKDLDKMCFEAGWNSDPIYFLFRIGFNMIECSKMIVKTFAQWDQWSWNYL